MISRSTKGNQKEVKVRIMGYGSFSYSARVFVQLFLFRTLQPFFKPSVLFSRFNPIVPNGLFS